MPLSRTTRGNCTRPSSDDALPASLFPLMTFSLTHLSIGFRHINFHGIYQFPLERYIDRLMPSIVSQPLAVEA